METREQVDRLVVDLSERTGVLAALVEALLDMLVALGLVRRAGDGFRILLDNTARSPRDSDSCTKFHYTEWTFCFSSIVVMQS